MANVRDMSSCTLIWFKRKNKIRILVLNDKAAYNVRYRQHLIDTLGARGHSIESCGLFEGTAKLLALTLRLLLGRNGLVLSSNMKSNLFTLLFCRRAKVIILNGMGRFRGNRRFRFLLRVHLGLRKNTAVAVQNYADFRYLRRYSPSVYLKWVPGSGGSEKPIGDVKSAVIVQRDNKIALVALDVARLVSTLSDRTELAIVGCTDSKLLQNLFPHTAYQSVGLVPPTEIFRAGGIFLQPTGYGEGFPHTLADAIVSGMEIYISDVEYLRYGLTYIGGMRQPVAQGWSRLVYNERLGDAVRVQTITSHMVEMCEGAHVKS